MTWQTNKPMMVAPPPEKPSCEQLADILPEPFVVIDRNYRIVAANQAYCRQYARDASEVIGRLCHEISHHSSVPCSRNGEHCPLEEIVKSGHPLDVMHVHYDCSGHEQRVQLHCVPIVAPSGEVHYIGEHIHPLGEPRGAGNGMLLVGRSRPLLRLISVLQRVAPTRTTVLLLGESGVGKEQAARYLHHFSAQHEGPFVVVDCGTLGEQLIENELFGHERGAFTGASTAKKGLFEVASGGTLFIDEIGDLPLPLQSKLLRVLETGSIRRLGGTSYSAVDVRVIAATNQDIAAMVRRGRFRADLYYRLSAFPVEVPALRAHKDDIAALAEHFLARSADGERHLPLSAEVIEALLEHDYPGNVRELRNVIERATILAGDGIIGPQHVRVDTRSRERVVGADRTMTVRTDAAGGRRGPLSAAAVRAALDSCNGYRAQAARHLGISERTLYRHVRRLRRLGLLGVEGGREEDM
jgi:transcriptional regulator with PAS, ATPase and Fis domain